MITLLTANLEWTITENLAVLDEFPSHHKKQLIAAVLNHIDKSISQPIQNKLTYKATKTPKAVHDNIYKILAAKSQVRHE